MANSNECPACGERIGIYAVFKASLPNRIRCPSCNARLEYGGTWGLIALGIVCMLGLGAAAIALLLYFVDDDPILAGLRALAVFCIGGALFEIGFALTVWYGGYELQRVGKPRQREDAEQDVW